MRLEPDDLIADLPITVPLNLHEAIAEAVSEAFAVSYLTGAVVTVGVLRPRTEIARKRLLESPEALRVLAEHHVHVGAALTRAEREPIPAVVDALRRFERTGKFA